MKDRVRNSTASFYELRLVAMDKQTLAIFVTIGFSVVGVIGDYFLKRASLAERSLRSVWFYVGFAVYALSLIHI